MPNFTAGTSFTDGVTNDVTAAKLNALVADAVPTSSLALASTSGTIANFTSSTANITLGTIPTLTTGTTTSTNEVVTNGTITNLSATTSTFLGTITGSTNVINIGSGQIYKDASGNVGVGTASPTNKLHIVNSGAGALALQTSAASSDQTQITFVGTTGNKWAIGNNAATGGTGTNFDIYDLAASANRLRIDSSGNVGVGTVSPADTNNFGRSLDIRSSTGAAAYFRDSDDASKYSVTGFFGADSNAYLGSWGASTGAVIYTSGTERLRIDSSGNVGIGTTSINARLVVSDGANGLEVAPNVSSSTVTQLTSYNRSTNAYTTFNFDALTTRFSISGTEALRIDSSGNVLVGTTSNFSADKMCLNFQSGQRGLGVRDGSDSSGADYVVFRNSSNGVIGTITRVTTTNAVAYNTSSDQRLKSNIADASPVLDKLMAVKVRQFDWTDGNLHQDAGFVAQELAPVLSGIVTEGRTQDDWWQIDYARLTPYLVKAVQELKAENDSLKSRIEALEAA
jgi:hypothetical protein